MQVYQRLAEIRRQEKNSETISENFKRLYSQGLQVALFNKLETDFWYRPLMRSTVNNQASKRNVLMTGQRIKFDKNAVIGAGGFSKIYKHEFNSSCEAVKVLDITGEFCEIFRSKDKNEPLNCLYEGKDKQTVLKTQISI